MLTIMAFELPHLRHFELTSLYLQGLAFHQCLRHLLVCRLNDPAEGLAGDMHFLCRLFLIETFEVGQPDGLKFINGQDHFL
jgi:hypothetical protein